MKEHKAQHSDNDKDGRTLIKNTLNSNLKTSSKSKSIEKNHFISTKENIRKVFDINIKNCLEKINILNTISRPPSVKSPNRKIIFNNENNEIFLQKNNHNIYINYFNGYHTRSFYRKNLNLKILNK